MNTAEYSNSNYFLPQQIVLCSSLAEDEALVGTLTAAGFNVALCADWRALWQRINEEDAPAVAAIVIATEMLPASWISQLKKLAAQQTTASNFPLTILLQSAAQVDVSAALESLTGPAARKIFAFERPISICNLKNLLHASLDLRRLQKNLWQLQQRKASSQQNNETFLMHLNDELRNPVAAIDSAIALLKQIEPASSRLQTARDILERQVGRLIEVFNKHLGNSSPVDEESVVLPNYQPKKALNMRTSRQSAVNHIIQILVVDDNRDAARGLAMVLESLGYKVKVAYDGYEALDMALSQKPQAVLLDLGLPKLDGYQVAKQLRTNPHFKKALLVAITGFGRDSSRYKAKKVGFDYHLTKPVKLEVLQQLLGTLTV